MVVCIIQARMDSSRLPGKVLINICGKPMLYHVVERVKQSRLIDKVIIATTQNQEDDRIEKLGIDMGTYVFRGSANDVLDRYYKCAKEIGARVIARITGDCPLVDPEIIDKTIKHFLNNNFDYVSNAYPKPSYPDGLDTEVFSSNALETAWNKARRPSEREHVTSYIWKNENGLFKLGSVKSVVDMSDKRWTVDNESDLKFVTEIYNNLYFEKPFFGTDDVLELLRQKPELEDINKGITRNEGYLKSVEADRGKNEKKAQHKKIT